MSVHVLAYNMKRVIAIPGTGPLMQTIGLITRAIQADYPTATTASRCISTYQRVLPRPQPEAAFGLQLA
jgi:hypothetical protein